MSVLNEFTGPYFNSTVERDFFNTLCGKRLGKGIGREVYECRLDPSLVIKIETGAGSFQNIVEWETWDEVVGTEFEKWFAPCVSISGAGVVLVQKKTKVISSNKLPDKMPSFLGDFKQGNFGMYKGHICAHDYGRTRLMEKGLTKRMRPVNWTLDLET